MQSTTTWPRREGGRRPKQAEAEFKTPRSAQLRDGPNGPLAEDSESQGRGGQVQPALNHTRARQLVSLTTASQTCISSPLAVHLNTGAVRCSTRSHTSPTTACPSTQNSTSHPCHSVSNSSHSPHSSHSTQPCRGDVGSCCAPALGTTNRRGATSSTATTPSSETHSSEDWSTAAQPSATGGLTRLSRWMLLLRDSRIRPGSSCEPAWVRSWFLRATRLLGEGGPALF